MSSGDSEKLLLLQEEVRSLSQELAQCQADKDFVWSLWKRLQAANPDLTQALSLVVEREKQKAEAKDRKVLEILQAKDYKIQELQKEVTSQQQEVGRLLQQRHASEDERHVMKKELLELQHTLSDTTKRFQECDDGWRRRLEEQQEQGRKQKDTVSTRLKECDDEWRRRFEEQQEQSRKQEETKNTKLKELLEELMKAQAISSSLSVQLTSLQQKLSERDQQLQQIRGELQELQSLYVQSVTHAGEQAELIQQLEGLNLDTQQILQSQEKVHTTHTASYHKLYSELSASYQTLRLGEEQLRKRDACLTEQLSQKEQQVSELQLQLQQLQQHVTPRALSTEKVEQECVEAAEIQETVSHHLSSETQSCEMHKHQCSSREAQKIQQLEELLTLKTAENVELKRAYAKRHDHLRLIQTNYRAAKEQLKEVEDTQGLTRRAEDWELRQENSDGVWNELAFFKCENRKLLDEKAELEEELDVARVRLATERATAQELRLCLQHEQKELHDDDDDDDDHDPVRITPQTPVHTLQRSVRKIEVLERKMACFEMETLKLQEDNEVLQDANDLLRREQAEVQAVLQQARVHEEETRALMNTERERLLGEVQALQAQLEKSHKVEMASRSALLRIRQEVGVLRAERDFHRNKTHRGRGRRGHSTTQTISAHLKPHNPAKDDWEDMSPDSDGGVISDVLETRHTAHHLCPAAPSKACTGRRPPQHTNRNNSTVARTRCTVFRQDTALRKRGRSVSVVINRAGVCKDREVRKRKMKRMCAVFTQKLASLQQQISFMQAASRVAHNEQLQYQRAHNELQTLTHTLQKQTCELLTLRKQKALLEVELEQLKSRPLEVQLPTSVTVSAPNPDLPNIRTLETEIKQLNNRLKSSSAEVSRQSILIKGLRVEQRNKDQRIKELQDKVCQCEKDVVMKRRLVEDLRSRLKVLQDSECSHRSHIDELERKVKCQSEDASNRKSFIESLKRRLSVATHDKQQCEDTISTLRQQIDTKEQKLTALQARLVESERSKVNLEQTATKQMQLLTNQSTETIHSLQNKLGLAQSQLQHLCTVTQVLAAEVDRQVRETRVELRKRKKERKKKHGVSRNSMVKAQSIAASILNISTHDLASILDTDSEEEGDGEADGAWMDRIQTFLQQQSPCGGELLDVLLVKMKENRSLMEKLYTQRASMNTMEE